MKILEVTAKDWLLRNEAEYTYPLVYKVRYFVKIDFSDYHLEKWLAYHLLILIGIMAFSEYSFWHTKHTLYRRNAENCGHHAGVY